jgi:hypothetical protein
VAVSANIEPDTGELADARTVFRAFDVTEFLEWPSWKRLVKILGANGGSYGLSGPRGAGKSWLMLRAIAWAQEGDTRGGGGIGLWYPSPSEYDPFAFLVSLSDSLASAIVSWYRQDRLIRARLVRARLGATVVALVAIGLAWQLAIAKHAATLTVVAVVVGTAVVLALAVRFLGVPLWRSLSPEGQLLREALRVNEWARYSATRREGSEVGGEGGRGLIARARISRERELVERPATLSSLVMQFRLLASKAGAVTGRVVIAIDELDKMADPEKVRDLLRDIKAIFEVRHVHFLVSVSDEAARNLSVGALTGRDEFNSSFYTVVQAQPATPGECAELLVRRGGVPTDVSLALAVLAGGNPREVVRLAELAENAKTAGEAAMKALQDEAVTLRGQVVTAVDFEGAPRLGQDAREGAYLGLGDDAFGSPEAFSSLCGRALEDPLWAPPWRDEGWEARFEETWRRLMVRLAVAGELAGSRDIVENQDVTDRLRDVVIAASQSSRVGRIVLERQLRLGTPRAPADAPKQDDVRKQLEELGARYESLRASMKGGPERTTAMDAVVSQARLLSREARFKPDEITAKLASKRAGERVVGLAAVQATGDPSSFPLVLGLVASPPTPFEQYQALRALEALRPGLSDEQRSDVVSKLSEPAWRERLRGDAPLEALAQRLLDALGGDSAPA